MHPLFYWNLVQEQDKERGKIKKWDNLEIIFNSLIHEVSTVEALDRLKKSLGSKPGKSLSRKMTIFLLRQ